MILFKRITIGLIALILIIAAVVTFAISSLDLNHHKARIEKLVLDKTGRQLQINGEIHASVFPWIGLALHDVTLANSVEFQDSEFATVRSGEFQVELLPLLFGNVNIQSVELQGLSLKLLRDADGKTNWDDLMAATAVVETDAGDNVVQEIEAGAPVAAALSIGGLQVNDASISYSDARANSYVSLNELSLTTGTIVLSESFDFESNFNMITSAADGINSAVVATGAIKLDLADNIYRLEQLQLNTVSSGAALPMDELPISISGDLSADLNSQTVDLVIEGGAALGIPISGEFHAAGLHANAELTGQLNSGVFDAASVFDQLGIAFDRQFDTELLQRASLSARFEQSNDQLMIDAVRATLSDIELTGKFQVTNLSSAGVLVGQLASNEFNPTPWLAGVGVPLSNELAPRTMRLNTSIRQSGQLLSFNQLSLALGDSLLTGDIEIADSKAANPPIKFVLAVDKINLDHYLPLDGRNGSDQLNEDSVSSSGNELLPIETLRQLNLEGDVTAGQLTLAGVSTRNVVLPILAKDGRIEVKEAKAELYSGSFFSTVSLDVQSDEPLLTVAATLNSVEAETFLQDFLHEESPLTGIANINVDVLSRGNSTQQLLERANGAISSRFTDGKVNGIDIAAELRRASRLLSGLALSDVSQSVSTGFSELSASAVVADGVLQSDDLVFTSPFLRLSGQGGINLASHSVDYLLHILLTDSPQLQQDAELSELAGIELSVPVRGQFNDLSVDFKTLLINAFESNLIDQLKARKAQWVDRQKEEVTDRIESEKAALQSRLEKEREAAAALMREKKEQAQRAVEEKKRQLEQTVEVEKEALKDKLENNLKKSLNGLLGED